MGLECRHAQLANTLSRTNSRPPAIAPSRPQSPLQNVPRPLRLPRFQHLACIGACGGRAPATSAQLTSDSPAQMTKVAVLGAAGGIGQPLSLLLKLNEVGRRDGAARADLGLPKPGARPLCRTLTTSRCTTLPTSRPASRRT